MKYIKQIIYIIAILIVFFQFRTCFIKTNKPDIRIDTVKVVMEIPGKENTFKKDSLIPVYIDTSKHYEKLFKELEKKYNRKADSVTILRELLQATRKREYKETFKDSVLDAEITAITTGTLDKLNFTYKTKPQEVRYNEITRYVTPKFRVVGGVEARTNGNLNGTVFGINAGIQGKKGSIYTLGYDTEKNIKFGVYVNLFDKY